MPPRLKPLIPVFTNSNETDEDDYPSTVKSKNKSGAVIGIIIAVVAVLAIFYFVRARCIKKRESGWECRKSVAKCRCCMRPPRSEEEGIKHRLEKK